MDGGIDHLAIYGEITAVVQDGLEAIKQLCNRGSARQPLAVEPDRFCVGNLVAVVEAQKPVKAAAVEDLKLGLIIGRAVERPQYRTDCADINPRLKPVGEPDLPSIFSPLSARNFPIDDRDCNEM